MNITDINWKGELQTLVDSDTKEPLQEGVMISTDNGRYMVKSGTAPHKPSSTGRVYVKQDGLSMSREFFPGVINAEWVTL